MNPLDVTGTGRDRERKHERSRSPERADRHIMASRNSPDNKSK